jgi:hypothetical protein
MLHKKGEELVPQRQVVLKPPVTMTMMKLTILSVVEEKNLKSWWTETNWQLVLVCSTCKLPPKTCACALPAKRVRKVTKHDD